MNRREFFKSLVPAVVSAPLVLAHEASREEKPISKTPDIPKEVFPSDLITPELFTNILQRIDALTEEVFDTSDSR